MNSCGCTCQDAHCNRGHQLLYEVFRLYARLQDLYDVLLLSARQREAVWQAYEQARSAYFAHMLAQEEKEALS